MFRRNHENFEKERKKVFLIRKSSYVRIVIVQPLHTYFMKKEEVLELMDSKRDAWLDMNTSYRLFSVSQIQIGENGLSVSDIPISKKALPRLMYRMGLNGKFMDYSKKKEVDMNSFKNTMENIVRWNGTQSILTRVEDSVVTSIVPCNSPEFFQNNTILKSIYDDLRQNVENLEDTRTIEQLSIDEEKKNISLSLVNPDSKFSIVENDEWVLGTLLSVGLTQTLYSPYYGRLVCLNGMVDGVRMKNDSISGKNYNENQIKTFIRRGFNLQNESEEMLRTICRNSINTPASLNEYLSFRSMLGQILGDNEIASTVMSQTFGIADIQSAYKVDIKETSETFRKSAICGLSVYELLNDVTNFTTHSDVISREDAIDMNKNASKWFLDMNWDNYDIAPKVNFKKNPAFSNSVVV